MTQLISSERMFGAGNTQEEFTSISGRKGVLLVAAALLIALALPAFAAQDQLYIPVISKGFQHQFWQAVKQGAEAAAKQYNVQITFEGPPTEADIQPQVQMLVNAMAKNPAAICLAALDTNSVMDQLNEAMQKHIPIIGFDSGVPNAPKGRDLRHRGHQQLQCGRRSRRTRCSTRSRTRSPRRPPRSPVTIVDFNQDATSQSVTDRGKGFRDEMIKLITTQTQARQVRHQGDGQPGLHRLRQPDQGKAVIIDVVVPATPKDTDATDSAQAILNRVKSDHILGIFCSNEGVVRAVLSASDDGSALPTQYPGLVVVGFDAGKAQKAAVKNKYFLGSITQDPVRIGFLAVELAYKAVKGQMVANVDTGAKFYDRRQHGSTRVRAPALRLRQPRPCFSGRPSRPPLMLGERRTRASREDDCMIVCCGEALMDMVPYGDRPDAFLACPGAAPTTRRSRRPASGPKSPSWAASERTSSVPASTIGSWPTGSMPRRSPAATRPPPSPS